MSEQTATTFVLATVANIGKGDARWAETTVQVTTFQELFGAAMEHAMANAGRSCGIFRPFVHHDTDEHCYLAEVYLDGKGGGSVEEFASLE